MRGGDERRPSINSCLQALPEDLVFKCDEFWLYVKGLVNLSPLFSLLLPFSSPFSFSPSANPHIFAGECHICGSSPLLLGTWEGKYVDINFKEVHMKWYVERKKEKERRIEVLI